MATDIDIVKQSFKGSYADNKDLSTDPSAALALPFRRTFEVLVADAATAGTAVTETVVARVPFACKVLSAYVATPIAVTANDTDYATFSLAKRDSAGANATAVASQTSKITGGSGNITAFAPVALTLTPANAELAAGAVLTIAVAKAGSGKALTAATSYVNVTVVVEAL